MKTKIAEAYVMELAGPVYGFALKRCACLQDAEDLSQEILLGAFTALKEREDIGARWPCLDRLPTMH